jgi:hypothetical protein
MKTDLEYKAYWAGFDSYRDNQTVRIGFNNWIESMGLMTLRLQELFERGWFAAKDGETDLEMHNLRFYHEPIK